MSQITSAVSGSTVLGIDGKVPEIPLNPDNIYFPDWNLVVEKGGLINILAASGIFAFKPSHQLWSIIEPYMDLTRPYTIEPPQEEKKGLDLPKITKV